MGLWHTLLGWLDTPAPTATKAEPAPEPIRLDAAPPAAAEPVLDPLPAAAAPAPAAAAALAPRPAVAAPFGGQQPDLFETAERDACINGPALREALSVYAGMAWDRQLDFADRIGELPWLMDAAKGQLQFGDDLRFGMQLLGSYNLASKTWQWIWACDQTAIHPASTVVAEQLRDFGKQQKLPWFTEPQSALRAEELHQIGLIASGADESAGYYLGNYGDDIVLALIDHGNGLPVPTPRPERVLTVVPQLIGQFNLNHRLLLRHYLSAKGFALHEAATRIMAEHPDCRVAAELDVQGHMISLSAC